jgi:hypothetical protein
MSDIRPVSVDDILRKGVNVDADVWSDLDEPDEVIQVVSDSSVLYVVPCLIRAVGGERSVPYVVRFLLPQYFRFVDTEPCSVRVTYLAGSGYADGLSCKAGCGFKSLLEDAGYRPISHLSNPIINQLLPRVRDVHFYGQAEFKRYEGDTSSIGLKRSLTDLSVITFYKVYYGRLYRGYSDWLHSTLAKVYRDKMVDVQILSDLTVDEIVSRFGVSCGVVCEEDWDYMGDHFEASLIAGGWELDANDRYTNPIVTMYESIHQFEWSQYRFALRDVGLHEIAKLADERGIRHKDFPL